MFLLQAVGYICVSLVVHMLCSFSVGYWQYPWRIHSVLCPASYKECGKPIVPSGGSQLSSGSDLLLRKIPLLCTKSLLISIKSLYIFSSFFCFLKSIFALSFQNGCTNSKQMLYTYISGSLGEKHIPCGWTAHLSAGQKASQKILELPNCSLGVTGTSAGLLSYEKPTSALVYVHQYGWEIFTRGGEEQMYYQSHPSET